MSHDLECPYCGTGMDICHDDGFGYAEDRRHEIQCDECEKHFVFETYISFYYEPSKADCLNGSAHKLEFCRSWPKEYSRMCCQDCDYERQATPEEISAQIREKDNERRNQTTDQ